MSAKNCIPCTNEHDLFMSIINMFICLFPFRIKEMFLVESVSVHLLAIWSLMLLMKKEAIIMLKVLTFKNSFPYARNNLSQITEVCILSSSQSLHCRLNVDHIAFFLTYVLYNNSWKPSYSTIRLDLMDGGAPPPTTTTHQPHYTSLPTPHQPQLCALVWWCRPPNGLPSFFVWYIVG